MSEYVSCGFWRRLMIIILKKQSNEKALKRIEDIFSDNDIVCTRGCTHGRKTISISSEVPLPVFHRIEVNEDVDTVLFEESELIKDEYSGIEINGRQLCRNDFTVIAGPCAIDNYDRLFETALALKDAGVQFFRGGAYKLRTSPYSFSGIGKKGLEYLKRISEETGLITVSEIISEKDVEMMSELVDIVQVGTRNMFNYNLLSELGKIDNPVILKRGMCSNYREWILAAEYIKKQGNNKIILCERGIRTFEKSTRNTIDITSIPIIKAKTGFPILVDPSHSTGQRSLVESISYAAAAAGADGLLIETEIDPDSTPVDSFQTIDIDLLKKILKKSRQIRSIIEE